jgi:hypothetical protein
MATAITPSVKALIRATLRPMGKSQLPAPDVSWRAMANGGGRLAGRGAQRVLEAVRHDFAESTQTIFYVMAGVLVACYVVAHLWLPKGGPEIEASPAGSPESSASAAT